MTGFEPPGYEGDELLCYFILSHDYGIRSVRFPGILGFAKINKKPGQIFIQPSLARGRGDWI